MISVVVFPQDVVLFFLNDILLLLFLLCCLTIINLSIYYKMLAFVRKSTINGCQLVQLIFSDGKDEMIGFIFLRTILLST